MVTFYFDSCWFGTKNMRHKMTEYARKTITINHFEEDSTGTLMFLIDNAENEYYENNRYSF